MKGLLLPACAALLGIFVAGHWYDGVAAPAAPQSRAQAPLEHALHVLVAQSESHRALVDVHNEAGVTCTDCHGESFTDPVPDTVCTDCHGSYEELAARVPWQPNPHASHMGEIPCGMCHKIHSPSVSFCDECHSFGMVVP